MEPSPFSCGADLVTESLRAAGVSTLFSLSGNQIMPVYDAAIDSGLGIVHVRHEAAAVFMADAAAQLTGTVGVALVTAAPGFANALGALFTARANESPVLLLSGDAAVGQDGRGAFQELDQVAMARPVTKHSMRASDAQLLGWTIAEAIRIATSGRPGPVHVALPFDVLQATVPGDKRSMTAPQPRIAASADRADVDRIGATLAAAERPVVLLGPRHNPTRAPGLAARLANAVDAPAIVMESPRGLNDPALGAIGRALAQADYIVCLGKAVDFTLGFGKTPPFAADCRWLVVDGDAAERARAALNLGARLVAAIDADPGAMAEALLERRRPHGANRAAWRSEVAQRVAARGFTSPAIDARGAIHPARLSAAVQRQIDRTGDAILVVDGGEFGQWAQACLSAPRRLINGPAGAIGGGMCAGIAAGLLNPGALVIALMGDGSAGFHFSELDTAARHGVRVVVVIGNDARWNAEHQIQLRDYGPDRLIGCGLAPTRYDLAAIGLGCHGEQVTRAEDLDAALDRAIASDKPAVVNVMIEGLAAPSGAGH